MNKRVMLLLMCLILVAIGFSVPAAGEGVPSNSTFASYAKAIANMTSDAADKKGLNLKDPDTRLMLRVNSGAMDFSAYNPVQVAKGPHGLYTVQFASAGDATKCLEALKKDKNVRYVERDLVVKAYETTPSKAKSTVSPIIVKEKSLFSAGQAYLSWGAEAMGVYDYTSTLTASRNSVTVAVIDTGVGHHEFLDSHVKMQGLDYVNPANKDGRDDGNGHGTHVAGTVCDMTRGLNVHILPLRVLDAHGIGYNTAIIPAIYAAADMGAKVINMSIGGKTDSEVRQAQEDAIAYARSKGVTVVVAAGNDDSDTQATIPASIRDCITVAAIDHNLKKAYFSNFGTAVDLAAPGVAIKSCHTGGGYVAYMGTSMASPHIAGLAAICKIANPSYSPAQVEKWLKDRCVDLGDAGWDPQYGYGIPLLADAKIVVSGDYRYKKNSDGVTITGYTGAAETLVIPETLDGYPVTEIGAKAFLENNQLVDVTVPGGVTVLCEGAFSGCANLARVTLQEGIARVDSYVFFNCIKLKQISLPKSLEALGDYALYNCMSLEAIALPDGLTYLGTFSIAFCTEIKSLEIPDGVNIVQSALAAFCLNLERVKISENATTISANAFNGCEKLTDVTMPKRVSLIEPFAFYNCSSLREIDLRGTRTIDYEVFIGCKALSKVIMPEVEWIGESTFRNCAALVSVDLPKTLQGIDGGAFMGTGLKALSLPDGMKALETYAFKDCQSLTKVSMGTVDAAFEPFDGCIALETIELREGVQKIPAYAFVGCKALKTVTFPKSIKEGDASLFAGSHALSLIRGYEGTVAEVIAAVMDVRFESLGKAVKLTSVTLPDELVLSPGDTLSLFGNYQYEPEDATYPLLSWESADEDVVMIVEDEQMGVAYDALLGMNAGSTTITGTAQDGSGIVVTATVVVTGNFITDLHLSKPSLAMKAGEAQTLTVKISPDTVKEPRLEWLSSDENVATVSDAGVVTAVSAGDAVITVRVPEENGAQDECTVRVTEDAVSEKDFVTVLEGEDCVISGYVGSATTVVVPAQIDGKPVIAIDEKAFEGKDVLKVVLPESVREIRAAAFRNCKALTSVKLPENLTFFAPGAFKGCSALPKVKKVDFRLVAGNTDSEYRMIPNFTPENTAGAFAIKSSAKKNVAVLKDGTLSVLGKGAADITLTCGKAKIKLSFAGGEPFAPTKIAIKGEKKRTLRVEEDLKLSYKLTPGHAETIIVWESADPNVATVDQEGFVTGVAPGKTVITVTTQNGKTAKVTVTVKANS